LQIADPNTVIQVPLSLFLDCHSRRAEKLSKVGVLLARRQFNDAPIRTLWSYQALLGERLRAAPSRNNFVRVADDPPE
jgi:hypothetical protein